MNKKLHTKCILNIKTINKYSRDYLQDFSAGVLSGLGWVLGRGRWGLVSVGRGWKNVFSWYLVKVGWGIDQKGICYKLIHNSFTKIKFILLTYKDYNYTSILCQDIFFLQEIIF